MLKLILEILEEIQTPDEIYLAQAAGRVEKKNESILIGIQWLVLTKCLEIFPWCEYNLLFL